MLYGDTVGKIFEAFYNESIWKHDTTNTLLSRVPDTLRRVIETEKRKGGVFNWSDPDLKPGTRSLEEVEAEVRETIPRGLRSVRHHRLLGRDAQAEVKLDHTVEGHILGGRADFIMHRTAPRGDLILLDGKGSRWRDKYVNKNQLVWYSMLYRMKHGVLPDCLGFLFWRFEPEESMDWSEVTLAEVESLQRSVLAAIGEIEQAKSELVQLSAPGVNFMAKPGSDCKLCSYQPLCPESNRKKPPKGQAHGVEDGDFSF